MITCRLTTFSQYWTSILFILTVSVRVFNKRQTSNVKVRCRRRLTRQARTDLIIHGHPFDKKSIFCKFYVFHFQIQMEHELAYCDHSVKISIWLYIFSCFLLMINGCLPIVLFLEKTQNYILLVNLCKLTLLVWNFFSHIKLCFFINIICLFVKIKKFLCKNSI